jgi:hypothetical protein
MWTDPRAPTVPLEELYARRKERIAARAGRVWRKMRNPQDIFRVRQRAGLVQVSYEVKKEEEDYMNIDLKDE